MGTKPTINTEEAFATYKKISLFHYIHTNESVQENYSATGGIRGRPIPLIVSSRAK